MSPAIYPGIRFPDRAEALEDFEGYRVFLDPWNPIADALRPQWEAAALRGSSHICAIHGPQGAGKTLLTRKLASDFETTKRDSHGLEPDSNNFWHRVSGGSSLDAATIRDATAMTDFFTIPNHKTWQGEVASFVAGQRANARVLLADNAERTYFRQGLVEMTDMEYLTAEGQPGLNRLAAQRLVDQLRTSMRGTLLVLLSNSAEFLTGLQDEVEQQHAGLMSVTNLELPGPRDKETVIRVNTNRLNQASYWAAIDQGTIADREALKSALGGDTTFPDSFRAVDSASRNRTGRPALRNVISLLVLTDTEDASVDLAGIGAVKRTEVDEAWLRVQIFEEGWAPREIGDREAGLLESEWTLRIAVLARPFVRALLAGRADSIQRAQVAALLEELKTFQGPGTKASSRANYTERLRRHVAEWTASDYDLASFWSAGQSRSTQYEPALVQVLPGYNTSASGFLSYRPDFVVNDFTPCAVSDAPDDTNDAIRAAIRRSAHVFEFTAIAAGDPGLVKSYLASKLPNYVRVTQEQ